MRLSRRASRLAFLSLFLCAGASQAQVVISQVYGGGGNSGATLKSDFIEIFNSGTSTVSLSGWSVQYASSAGTTWFVTNLSGSIGPGQYYLVKQADGTGGTVNLPTPDATGTTAMSATAGKVILSNSTTAQTTACPAIGGAVVDRVAFNTTTSCSTNGTAATSNTTAALRKDDGCTNTSNNANDFSTGAPNPRNTASSTKSCGTPTPTDPTVVASVSNSNVLVGESVTIRGTVVFGTNPTSTGVAVVADLSPIGGSATQALFDDGAHDDGAAGDKVYGFVATVAAGTTTGQKVIGVGVADAEARDGADTETLNVVELVQIHDVQGNGNTSPHLGEVVALEGIVTARKNNGFFIQAAEADYDADPATSEGIFVFTSSTPTTAANVGNRVRAVGTVLEFVSSSNPHQLKITELGNFASYSTISTGNALPAATALPASGLQPTSPLDALERYEGMRVSVASVEVVAPVGAFITESTAASPPDGTFYGVLPGVARPFREEGVGALDVVPFPPGVNPPTFDTNPERLRVQSTGQLGGTAIAVDVGDTVDGLVGVLDYAFATYALLLDPGSNPTVTPGSNLSAVSVAGDTDITIGGFNLLRFFDDVNFTGPPNAPGTGDAVLQSATLLKRLKKTANAICAYVRNPDILGVVEVENLSVLQQLADTINSGNTQHEGSCASNPQYVAYLQEGNDIGGIDVGFLVSTRAVAEGVARVEVLEVVQIGKNSTLSNPDGSTSTLNDRPSLMLRARVHQGNGASYDVTVIANHLRSLSDHNSEAAGSNGWATEGARVRAKRAAQALEVAQFVHDRQVSHPGERIVLLGDFNAFEFNDGYVDSMGVVTGREADSTEVLNYVDSPIAVPLTTLVEEGGYSFSFDGNAQSLDHMVVNQALLDSTAGVRAEHARINADFGEDNYGDFTVPVRVSDHDPVVLFLTENSFGSADLAVAVTASASAIQVGRTLSFGVGVANGGPDVANVVALDLEFDAAIANLSMPVPAGWSCGAPVVGADSTTVHCTIASLAVGTSASFRPTFVVSRELGGRTITLEATISTQTTDAFPANNFGSSAVRIDANADLVSIARAPSVFGGILKSPGNFSVTARNNGPHDARNAVLAIAVNGPASVVTGISGAGLQCELLSDTPTMSQWACPTGAWFNNNRTATLTVGVDPAQQTGSDKISVGTGFSSETNDPFPANNASAAAVRVR